MEIIPGILEKDWAEIEKKINLARQFSKTIHIDIIDGKFAPNTTFLDPLPFRPYTKDILFEAHLMVDEPIEYLKPFADVGFRRFLGHIEKMSDQVEFVAEAQFLGEVGLVIDTPSSIDVLDVPLDDLDCLLIMTVKAGFSGQEFMSDVLEKVKTLRSKTLHEGQRKPFPIEVDGGINDKTVVDSIKSGANRFVATSFIFNSQNPQAQYQFLEKQIR